MCYTEAMNHEIKLTKACNRRLHITKRNIDFELECNISVFRALFRCKITYIKWHVMLQFNEFAMEIYVEREREREWGRAIYTARYRENIEI